MCGGMLVSMPTKKNARPPAECPLCGYRFKSGTLGWHTHVGNAANHPKWRPDLHLPSDRQKQFQEDFPDFFKNAASSNRRVPPSDRREGMGPPSKQLVPQFMRAKKSQAVPPPASGAEQEPRAPAPPLPGEFRETVKSEPKIRLTAANPLADALAEAAKAGKWEVVERLTALLEAKPSQ